VECFYTVSKCYYKYILLFSKILLTINNFHVIVCNIDFSQVYVLCYTQYLIYIQQTLCNNLHREVFLQSIVVHCVFLFLNHCHVVAEIPVMNFIVKKITILLTLKIYIKDKFHEMQSYQSIAVNYTQKWSPLERRPSLYKIK